MNIQVRDQRKPGWCWVHRVFVRQHAAKVGPYATMVYLAMCDLAKPGVEKCYTSCRQMAELLGISVGSVSKAIQALIAHQLIAAEEISQTEKKPSVYVLLEIPEQSESRSPHERPGESRSPHERQPFTTRDPAVHQVNNIETKQETNTETKTLSPADSSEPSVDLKKQAKEQLQQVWQYYLRKFTRTSPNYSFTKFRQAKGLSRLRECYKKTGDIQNAGKLLLQAIDALAESKFHREGGFIEWETHLFGSEDKLERWLNRPARGPTGPPEGFSGVDAAMKARARATGKGSAG